MVLHLVAGLLDGRGPVKDSLFPACILDPGAKRRVQLLRAALREGIESARQIGIKEGRESLILLYKLKNGLFWKQETERFLRGDEACAGRSMNHGA